MPNQNTLGDVYTNIARYLQPAVIETPREETALLGAWISGVLKVRIDNDPSRYYISFPLGGNSTALHYGRVGPVAGTEIKVISTGKNDYEILHQSADRAQGQTIVTPEIPVPDHHHGRGGLYEDEIDPRLITYLKVISGTGLNFTVAQGRYDYHGLIYWWTDDTTPVNLATAVPDTANKKSITIIGIDPISIPHTIVFETGSLQDEDSALDIASITDIDFTILGYIPICFVVLHTGQTTTEDSDYTSLFDLVAPGDFSYIATVDAAVSDPPTPDELDVAFPEAAEGRISFLDVDGVGDMIYLVGRKNSKWWLKLMEESVPAMTVFSPPDGSYIDDTTPTFTWS